MEGEQPRQIARPDHRPLRVLIRDTGSGPVGTFVHGFRSRGDGAKAMALANHARQRGRSWLRFEFHGHGADAAAFAGFRVSRALAELEAIIDDLAPRPVVLVGSSMGGWLSWLAALRRPRTVASMLLIAPAADLAGHFLDRIDRQEIDEWRRQGRRRFPDPYAGGHFELDFGFIEDARALAGEHAGEVPSPGIGLGILHGARDEVVPPEHSVALAAATGNRDLLEILETEGHRLEGALDHICARLDGLWPDTER